MNWDESDEESSQKAEHAGEKEKSGTRGEDDGGQWYDSQERELIQGKGSSSLSLTHTLSVHALIINLFLSSERTAESDLRTSSHRFLCYFKEA